MVKKVQCEYCKRMMTSRSMLIKRGVYACRLCHNRMDRGSKPLRGGRFE